MNKTFTCKELGGICDEKFSGTTFEDIMQKGSTHMMSDDAHKQKIMSMYKGGGETKEQWMERMHKEFESKQAD